MKWTELFDALCVLVVGIISALFVGLVVGTALRAMGMP